MKFLLDTNIFIPLEPTSPADISANSGLAFDFARAAVEAGAQLYLHPLQQKDIASDKDSTRKALRESLLQKYPLLPHPPEVSQALAHVIGVSAPSSHDFVDDHLLAAVHADAVDVLVTSDLALHRKAKRASLADRVLTLADALSVVEELYDHPVAPHQLYVLSSLTLSIAEIRYSRASEPITRALTIG